MNANGTAVGLEVMITNMEIFVFYLLLRFGIERYVRNKCIHVQTRNFGNRKRKQSINKRYIRSVNIIAESSTV